jgi:putative transposase
MLSYKAESAGMKVIKVDARNTSKECSNCGNVMDMPLSHRTYICNKCGMQMDRDINAAINILTKATLGQRESNAQGDICLYNAKGIASSVEELRTDKTHPLQDAVIA